MQKFLDRHQAGKILAKQLKEYAHRDDVLVLALPRGGVPVAYEVAKTLGVPLDVFIVRKLGLPGHEEFAMGAIATGGIITVNQAVVDEFHLTKASVEHVIQLEHVELLRREKLYRGKRSYPDFSNKTIILVDDGIATGSTIRAAIKALRQYALTALIIAVPVASHEICQQLEPLVKKLVCPLKPINFYAVGYWYDDFSQTSDETVISLLNLR